MLINNYNSIARASGTKIYMDFHRDVFENLKRKCSIAKILYCANFFFLLDTIPHILTKDSQLVQNTIVLVNTHNIDSSPSNFLLLDRGASSI